MIDQVTARETLRAYEAAQRRQSFAADLTAERERRRNGDRAEEPLGVRTARETCELPDPPGADELLGSVLVRGQRLVLGAHTGEGKTTMGLAIVRAVTRGEPFLEWNAGERGRALVIDAEQGLRTIKRRLHEAGLADSDDVDFLRVPDGLALDRDPQHVAQVERVIAGGYSVVLADPLYKLHAGDSNDERAAVDLMRRLDAWREEHRFALALPVHCRKPPVGAKFTMHELFGSSAYLRGAEVVLGLQRVRNGYSRLHFFKDRDGDLPVGEHWGLLFDREQGYRRDPEDAKPKQTAAQVIHELLEAQPGMTLAQLHAETGYAERTIRDALRKMGADEQRAGAQGEKQWSLEDEVTGR